MGPGPETARRPGSDIRTQLAKKKIVQVGVDFFYYRVVLFVLFKLSTTNATTKRVFCHVWSGVNCKGTFLNLLRTEVLRIRIRSVLDGLLDPYSNYGSRSITCDMEHFDAVLEV